jgi:uncharacterized protein DUF3383
MSNADRTIQITIQLGSRPLSQAAFNKPMIAGYHTVWPDLIRDYDLQDPTDFETDFASWPGMLDMYTAAQKQNPNAGTISVGRLTVATTKSIDIFPVAANLTPYTIEFDNNLSLLATYTSDSTGTVPEICAALTTAINTLAISGLTATNNTTSVNVSGTAGTYFRMLSTAVGTLNFKESTASPSPLTSAQLTAIAAVRNDWYSVEVQDHSAAILVDAASYVEGASKLMTSCTADYDCPAGTGGHVGLLLKTAGYQRTHLDYCPDTGAYVGTSLMSYVMAISSGGVNIPGSFSFNYQPIVAPAFSSLNVGALGQLTTNQINNLITANMGAVQETLGVNTTFIDNGYRGAGGNYLDVTFGLDYFDARLRGRIWAYQSSGRKIPEDDAGSTFVEGFIKDQQAEEVRGNFFLDNANLTTSAIPFSQQNPVDVANRTLKGIGFTADLAGNVEKINVAGVVNQGSSV